jgi:hypothetical protein
VGAELSEGDDHEVLRHLADAGEAAGAVEGEPDDWATDGPGPVNEGFDHLGGLRRAAGEDGVGGGSVVIEAQVVDDDAEDVLGLVRPARHAQVDLGHGALTVSV